MEQNKLTFDQLPNAVACLINEEEAAKYLSISVSSLHTNIDKRGMPFYRGDNKFFFCSDEINNWIRGIDVVQSRFNEVPRQTIITCEVPDNYRSDEVIEYSREYFLQNVRRGEMFITNGIEVGRPYEIDHLIGCNLIYTIPASIGLYMLFNENELVYIGMSKNVRSRIKDHYRNSNMDFNMVLWSCDDGSGDYTINQVLEWERGLILKLQPKLNKTYVTRWNKKKSKKWSN